jgi:hypothetical protein
MAMAMVMTMIGNKAGEIAGEPVNFDPASAATSTTNPLGSADFTILQNGTYDANTDGTWVDDAAGLDSDKYEVRAVQNSGDTVTGTLSSWIAISALGTTWTLTPPVEAGTKNANVTVTIRQKLNTDNTDSIVVTFIATNLGGGGT